MTKMFDENFDPYLELQIMQQELQHQNDLLNKVIKCVSEQSNTIQQLSSEWVKVTQQNVRLHQQFNALLERIENEVK